MTLFLLYYETMSWLKNTSQNYIVIRRAFPTKLQELVDEVFKKHVKQHDSYPIGTDEFFLETNEKVLVPARIHTDPYSPDDLSGTKKLIYDCICSRSTNGYSREKALRSLYATKPLPLWTIPYLYLSLSDYVIEISSIVSPDDEDTIIAFQRLSKLNPEQYRLTEARAISYWSEWYRYQDNLSRQEYPALEVVKRICLS